MAIVGKRTPAPRPSPPYIGAVVALAGAALFYESPALGGYAAAFLIASHILAVSYEEPTLRTMFGADYDDYRGRVRRWWPRWPRIGRYVGVLVIAAGFLIACDQTRVRRSPGDPRSKIEFHLAEDSPFPGAREMRLVAHEQRHRPEMAAA